MKPDFEKQQEPNRQFPIMVLNINSGKFHQKKRKDTYIFPCLA